MQLGIFEILQKADEAPTEEEKIRILRENNNPVLERILLAAYDKRVEWDLPPGIPPYHPAPPVGFETAFYKASEELYLFIKGGGAPPSFGKTQREVKFIQLLESIDPRDAVILGNIKDKKLPYKTLTPNLIDKAFPNFLDLGPRDIVQEEKEAVTEKKVSSKRRTTKTKSRRKSKRATSARSKKAKTTRGVSVQNQDNEQVT